MSQAFIIKVKRALLRMWQHDIWHLQPNGPLSWRYLLPNQSAQIKLHRHLWWHSRYKLPGLLWLPLEIVRYLHWQLWAVSRRLKSAITSYSEEVASLHGVSIEQQQRNLSYWARTWCIDPYTAYNWQLYRSEIDGLHIIFENETFAFHALQNNKTGATKADHRLLGDKIKLAEKLSALGIPMVVTTRVSHGEWQDVLNALAEQPRIFCKLRAGNQGESAFAVWQAEQGMCGLGLDGKQLPDEHAVKAAWQILCTKGAVLIQPLLENHPALSPASEDGSAITLRVVTRVCAEGINLWFAELQIPGKLDGDKSRGFWRVAANSLDGKMFSLPKQSFLKKAWQEENGRYLQQLANAECVPFWQEICQHSIKAHQQLPKVWAIAWDWVITPVGPVLLEGNSGWGLDTPQIQLGGFGSNLKS